MPVSQYPTPFNAAHPAEPAGPIVAVVQSIPPDYRGTIVKEFKDGGANIGMSTENATLRFLLFYHGLFAAEVETLDNHWVEALGIAEGFNFRHPRTDILYTDVHYESFEYPEHRKIYMQQRRIILIKRPTG